MIDFLDTERLLESRGIHITTQDFVFVLAIVLGEDTSIAYGIAYDNVNLKKAIGDDEEAYKRSVKADAEVLLRQQHIVQLREELEIQHRSELQSAALNIKDVSFSAGDLLQILQNLLRNQVDDLDSASTRDVIQLVKMLTDTFGLAASDEGFQHHFIQVYPPFNALCQCGREFDVVKGIDAVCPHCHTTYHWVENENRFYPQPSTL